MNKRLLIPILTAMIAGNANAQIVYTQDDTIRTEAVDMPEGIFVSEDELMKDYTNKTNLSEGSGIARTVSYNDSILISRLSRIPTTIDLPLNDITRSYIDKYSNKMKGSVSVMLGALNFYNPIFEEALERYNIPQELKYLPVIESALRPSATSPVGAAGLWQFMPSAGKQYGLEVNTLVDERRDPIKSSEAAARFLSDLYNTFGDWSLAIAAYNCGPGNVQKALIRSGNQDGADFWTIYNRLPHETRGYVPAFIAATYIMNYYCEHGITPREASLPMESDTIIVQKEVSFAQISSKCNITMDELRAINPQYRRDIIPANYTLRLPASAIESFLMYEDSIYKLNPRNIAVTTVRSEGGDAVSSSSDIVVNEPVSYASNYSSRTTATRTNTRATNTRVTNSRNKKNTRNRHTNASRSVTVKNGDTLSAIAKRNGTTVSNLRKLNGIKGDMIRTNQKIRVK